MGSLSQPFQVQRRCRVTPTRGTRRVMAIDKHTQEEIQRLHKEGYGYRSISKKLNISKSTARRYVKGLKQIDGYEVRI